MTPVVTGCEFRSNGAERIWHFRDRSTVVETPALPEPSRFRYYDAHNHNIYDRSSRTAMKRAVNLYKKQRGMPL